jgi:hypothetical protein
LLERLRTDCRSLWGTSTNLYFKIDELLRELSNPNLHDIPTQLPFRVEMWNESGQHIRWLNDSERAMLMGGACAKAYRWSPKND